VDVTERRGLKWPNIRREYVAGNDESGITTENKNPRGMYAVPYHDNKCM
jgi:hypothetical protein